MDTFKTFKLSMVLDKKFLRALNAYKMHVNNIHQSTWLEYNSYGMQKPSIYQMFNKKCAFIMDA